MTIHGRSRQQRYSKLADWDYVYQCARKAPTTLPVVGNGDVFSFVDWNNHRTECPELATDMVARGALIKVSITLVQLTILIYFSLSLSIMSHVSCLH